MAPYLDTVKSFADVPITDAGVDTLAFLEACAGVVGLFDLLNSSAFSLVTSDLKNNIKKVQDRYNATPTQSATLESLIENEMNGKKDIKNTATEGLMWLLRGLAFTCKALQAAQANKSIELSTAFTESYSQTLATFHNFIVKKAVTVSSHVSTAHHNLTRGIQLAMKACPYREKLYEALSKDPNGASPATPEQLNEALNKWLAALDNIVQRFKAFYKTKLDISLL
ncbi:hypothetical protein H0H92_012162 [Tricholoma furcatifolium]|nr:hypothetical protein H0H92_012162 [Tricholoma furcatifolium]